MFTDLSKSSVQYFSDSGEILLTSSRVMDSRVRPVGLIGNGAVGHACITGRVELRDRALLHAEERFTGEAVEQEQQPLFRRLRDGGNPLAVLDHLDERRRQLTSQS